LDFKVVFLSSENAIISALLVLSSHIYRNKNSILALAYKLFISQENISGLGKIFSQEIVNPCYISNNWYSTGQISLEVIHC
jgi:uncharacterized protein YpmS